MRHSWSTHLATFKNNKKSVQTMPKCGPTNQSGNALLSARRRAVGLDEQPQLCIYVHCRMMARRACWARPMPMPIEYARRVTQRRRRLARIFICCAFWSPTRNTSYTLLWAHCRPRRRWRYDITFAQMRQRCQYSLCICLRLGSGFCAAC